MKSCPVSDNRGGKNRAILLDHRRKSVGMQLHLHENHAESNMSGLIVSTYFNTKRVYGIMRAVALENGSTEGCLDFRLTN